MINPTVGRVMHYFPSVDAKLAPNAQPMAALVAFVVNDTTVNLTVSNADGSTFGAQNIPLVQEGQAIADASKPFACWMPYQLGQAAKPEAVTAATPQLTAVHNALDTIALETNKKVETLHQTIQDVAAPIHDKVTALETSTQNKFTELGDWLGKTFKDFEARLSALSATDKPAPGADAAATAAATQAAANGVTTAATAQG